MSKPLLRSIIVVVSILSAGLLNSVNAQKLAIKNNLLYDVTGTPNISLELRTGERWTTELTLGFKPFPMYNPFDYRQDVDKRQKHLLIEPAMRYWICSPWAEFFVSGNAFWTHYNIGGYKMPLGLMFTEVENKRFQGDAVGAGLSAGYAWILGKRWNFEVELGVDLGYTWYDRYECAHCGILFGSEDKFFVTPKAGINFVYFIK